jgi:hypothetical protein
MPKAVLPFAKPLQVLVGLFEEPGRWHWQGSQQGTMPCHLQRNGKLPELGEFTIFV